MTRNGYIQIISALMVFAVPGCSNQSIDTPNQPSGEITKIQNDIFPVITKDNKSDYSIIFNLEMINGKKELSSGGYLPAGEDVILSFSANLKQISNGKLFQYKLSQVKGMGLRYLLEESSADYQKYKVKDLFYNFNNGFFEATFKPGIDGFVNNYLTPFCFYAYMQDFSEIVGVSHGYGYRFSDNSKPILTNNMLEKWPTIKQGETVKLSCNAIDSPVIENENYGAGINPNEIWVGVITNKDKNSPPAAGDQVTFYPIMSEGSNNYYLNYKIPTKAYGDQEVIWYYFRAKDLSVEPNQNIGLSSAYYITPTK